MRFFSVASFRLFAFEHAANAANNAAQWELAALICKKYFAVAARAIEPTLQQSEMLVELGSRTRRRNRRRRESFRDARLHGPWHMLAGSRLGHRHYVLRGEQHGIFNVPAPH